MEDATIALNTTSPKYTLLECALKTRFSFTKWELIQACLSCLQPPQTVAMLSALPELTLLHQMIDTVFQDDPASIPAVKAMYAKAKPVVEPEMDEETCLLLQEMVVSDQVNSADLKAYQDDLKKAQVNALNRKRKDMEEKVKADNEAKKKRRDFY